MWVQGAVRSRRFRIKILGTTNRPNILTKPKTIDNIRARMPGVGVPVNRENFAQNSCAHTVQAA